MYKYLWISQIVIDIKIIFQHRQNSRPLSMLYSPIAQFLNNKSGLPDFQLAIIF